MITSRKQRFFLICVFFVSVAAAVVLRLFWLHIFKSKDLIRQAEKQYTLQYRISPQRGRILDCQGNILAEDIVYFSLF